MGRLTGLMTWIVSGRMIGCHQETSSSIIYVEEVGRGQSLNRILYMTGVIKVYSSRY